MAARTRFEIAFDDLRLEFTARTKRDFLNDLRGQLEENVQVEEILQKWRAEPHYVAVSFDRKKNDLIFSYGYFDLVLVALDAIAGGAGIYKPVNQLRVLRWHATKADLVKVLRYVGKLDRKINPRRLLILPYPNPPIGHRIDGSVHRS